MNEIRHAGYTWMFFDGVLHRKENNEWLVVEGNLDEELEKQVRWVVTLAARFKVGLN